MMAKGFVILVVVTGLLLTTDIYGEWISGGRGWNYSNADTNFYPWSTACRVGIGTISPTQRLHIDSGLKGAPVTSGSTQTYGTLRLRGGDNSVLDIGEGTSPAGAWWIQSTDKTDHSYNYVLALNPNGGNVGIGTTSPGAKLNVVGNALFNPNTGNDGTGEPVSVELFGRAPAGSWTPVGGIRFKWYNQNPSSIEILRGPSSNDGSGLAFFTSTGTTNTAERMRIDKNGNVTGTYGDYHVSSDARLKKDVVTIPNALKKVLALRGVNFRWKNPNKGQDIHIGMVAQEVEPVVPEVVHTADDEMKTKAVEYQYIVALLVEAIKAQQKEIEELKSMLKQ